ncbi:hypothetical protein MBLNU459_g8259t2 [Dothideomycetes sp. NU459]
MECKQSRAEDDEEGNEVDTNGAKQTTVLQETASGGFLKLASGASWDSAQSTASPAASTGPRTAPPSPALARLSPRSVPEADPLGKVHSPLNGVYMLQKVDMPSFVSEEVDRSTLARPLSNGAAHGATQQSALDTPTPALDDLPGSWPLRTVSTPNGFAYGGLDGSLLSHPNGKSSSSAAEMQGSWDRGPSGKGSVVSMRSKKSSGLENEKKSTEVPASTRTPTADDDSYFAGLANGKPNGLAKMQPSVLPSSKPSFSAPGESALPNGARGNSPALQPVASHSALPPVVESSPPPSADGMLRVPRSTHRASSPPAFSQTSPSLAPHTPGTPANRLTHRHTLEVPKPTGRTSRDGAQPMDDSVVSATGRFSPNTPSRRRGSAQLVRRTTRSIHSDMHLDEVAQDEDAARWAEHIKQKRASKRKRDDDDDRVIVGTKVDQNHVNWVTAYNMLTGIRFTVSRTNAKIDRELTDADFDARHKFSFDITGNELTPSAKYDFKFKDYAPWVFRHLRGNFKLDPADYLVSLTSKYILSELGSPGKSGSFFYFSRDYKYIIKTIHHAEHKFLRKILREYYNHVTANPNTLLSQFYGLHRVKIPYGRKIHFVVMNNLFPPHRDIHRTFDLKGSTIGRDFREEDLEKNPRATLKDLNWLRRNLHLEFGPTKKDAFIKQMQQDVALLQKLKIMDYSLLVGIHDLERGNEENLRDKTLQVFQPGGGKGDELPPNMLIRTPSKLETARKAKELRQLIKNEKPIPMDQTLDKMPDTLLEESRKEFYFYSDDGGFRATHENNRVGEEIYYLGIIDCLTHYSFIKRAEHFFKGLASEEKLISAIPPERYGDRFIKFISGITKTRERAEAEKEQQLETHDRVSHAIQSIEGTLDDPQLSGVNMLKDGNPAGTDIVMQRAERQAEMSRRHGASEAEAPDRSISAVRSPDPDRSDMVTLPVIGEAAESGTGSANSRTPTANVTPQLSKESLRSTEEQLDSRAVLDNMEITSQTLGEVPPPTPPKTDGTMPAVKLVNGDSFERGRRPPTPPKDALRPPTPPKDRRYSRDKELPLPPLTASVQLSASPSRTSEDEMESLRARISELSS